MGRFALRRFFSGLLTVFVVFALNFVIIHAAPGNPVKSIIGKETSNPELTQALMDKWGLNDPLSVQFSRQLGNTLKGDLGTSILYNRPVNEMILERLGATLLLGVVTAVLSLFIGTALGVVCARKEGSWLDRILSVITYALDSMPSFWLGLMLIILFSSKLGLLPTQGMENVRAGYTGLRHVLDVLHHLILPPLPSF